MSHLVMPLSPVLAPAATKSAAEPAKPTPADEHDARDQMDRLSLSRDPRPHPQSENSLDRMSLTYRQR